MKLSFLHFLIILTLFFFTSIAIFTFQKKEEVVISKHPIDDSLSFTEATTSLQVVRHDDEDEYTIEWKTVSTLSQKIDKRHDISLLYEDGKLKDIQTYKKENVDEMIQKVNISAEDSGHFEAISYHYGETYHPNDEVKIVQSMSFDQLYVLDSPLSPIEVFKVPKNQSETEGKKILDKIIQQNLQYTWYKISDYFQIPLEKYQAIPLPSLSLYSQQPLPDLNKKTTDAIIADIWQAIYKHYFKGIQTQEGAIVSPIDSCVPLILIEKNYSHVIIIFEKGKSKYQVIINIEEA